MTVSTWRLAAIPGLALTLFACAPTNTGDGVRPAFYVDLAGKGARLDPVSSAAIINDYRRGLGLAPLIWDETLAQAAEAEATELATRDSLLSAPMPAKRGGAREGDIRRSVSGGYHTVADAFSGWRGSPAHDAVLREPNGKGFAIAASARPGSRHRVYWVMLVRTR